MALFNQILVLIVLSYLFIHLYTSIRNRIILGKVQLAIASPTRAFNVITSIIFGLIALLSIYLNYQNSVINNLNGFVVIGIAFLSIINEYKIGLIRMHGVSTPLSHYKWEEIDEYYYYNKQIILCINKKLLFSSKDKEVKWKVTNRQLTIIRKTLDSHIRR